VTAPETVLIRYTSPDGLTVTDITDSVLYADAYFELQAAAVPGSFHITVKDPAQTHSFISGGVIEMWIGGTKMYGGFVSVPTRDFFFPADRTDKPVMTRRWSLDGVDFNHLLDKRILRNPANYTQSITPLTNTTDKAFIATFTSYFDTDFSGGGTIDFSTKVTEVNNFGTRKIYYGEAQGDTLRAVLDRLVIDTTVYGSNACIYWLDSEARLNWLALQTTAAPWGFSDVPDGTDFIGWRDGAASEDGSSVVNEVFIWGGSPINSSTVATAIKLAHKWNQTSIDTHGRWQLAEAHPGEELYKSQVQVDSRANALISGDTSGTSPVTGSQGLVNPDTQYTLTWFAHDVPMDGGVRQHLIPGNVTTLNLWSFSEDNGVTPFAIDVPLRQVRITFPTLPSENPDEDDLSYVQFQGTFGLQMADPVWWWAFLRKMRPAPQAAPIITTDNNSASFPYGSYFTGSPKEAPGSGRTVFSIIPTYIPGSLDVFINGIVQTPITAFTETSPDEPTGGTFTFTTAPVATDTIVCTCRTG
jgi:hypothetical protein